MKQLTIFALISMIFMANAMAGCRLNDSGDNICTGENALFISDPGNPDIEEAFEAVEVKELSFPSALVKLIIDSRKKLDVQISDLVGNIICSDDEPVCKGDKVSVLPQCEDKFGKNSYKVLDVFQNGLALLKKSRFSSQKMLIAQDCLSVIKHN